MQSSESWVLSRTKYGLFGWLREFGNPSSFRTVAHLNIDKLHIYQRQKGKVQWGLPINLVRRNQRWNATVWFLWVRCGYDVNEQLHTSHWVTAYEWKAYNRSNARMKWRTSSHFTAIQLRTHSLRNTINSRNVKLKPAFLLLQWQITQ